MAKPGWRMDPKIHLAIQIENLKYGEALQKVPKSQWPPFRPDPRFKVVEAWRSRTFLVQITAEKTGVERLSISRTTVRDDGEFEDGITWDDLQRLKTECGRGDKCAVEIYPPDAEVVNVANMRHLWILDEPPVFMWKKEQKKNGDNSDN